MLDPASESRAALRQFAFLVIVPLGQRKKRIDRSYNDSTTRAECDAKVRLAMSVLVMAWFTQHSTYEDKRSYILMWKTSQSITLEILCSSLGPSVNFNEVFMGFCHDRFKSFSLRHLDLSLHRNSISQMLTFAKIQKVGHHWRRCLRENKSS